MRTKTELALTNVKEFRKELGMNQAAFWPLFGTTQSGGSRYERSREIPEPVAMLLALFSSGAISKEDLEKAVKVVESAKRQIVSPS